MSLIATDKKIRMFICIEPSEEAREVLAETIRSLDLDLPDKVRWVREHRFHLTVKFFGDVYTSLTRDILSTMHQVTQNFDQGKFQLGLSRLGMFPDNKRPRVIWAGVQGDLTPLFELHQSLDQSLSSLGFSLDQSHYQPHITLGRPRRGLSPREIDSIAQVVLNWRQLESATWEVNSLHLIHSVLEPGKTEYITLGSASI